ncbi:UDP-3-O-(3-hydroxymyristoyl)glucosamine N-acyltransferase [Alloalcanivorax gelatiniphagus]|uniref:UDP-3-O-acylglucosamine N-acyltransferase n=1 Tax=Alloalcanivorax gelatiniphagus TaxID=1194167 RepID=A0ABY2XLK4_9GAMM|nr:UDP-3-O-(3-hydroxymyristoyl)glucosamine N-acyltransferase [Alloalcanivorax gelatiniphagus]TMW13105.1 UDP-3-O-(3-hydroxymyristoyl)glucosamine N-acyltransferase [Alloalcanivorax gelatiniphagus]|tara:strand:+ start:9559 stop:10575 length:1017 start_codon:yes stop_codon:yes gene_type:complete
MAVTLAFLAEELGAELHGPEDLQVSGLGTLASARGDQLSFLANPRYRSQLETTGAAAVLLRADQLEHCPVAALVVSDPYMAYARVSRHFDTAPVAPPGVHPSAVVDPAARVPASASIGPNVVIEADVVIGEGVVIGANTVIGARCEIGDGCHIWPNVTIYHGVTIGPRSIIHAHCVLGADGFGFAPGADGWTKIAQVGGVRIGADVEIGAGTTVDRGAIDDTVIGNGVILDNQIQVAHNVVIGDHTAIAGKVGIAGSTRIGAQCMIGGAAGLSGHLEICDKVQILGMSLVSRSISEPGTYGSALPVDRQDRYRRNVARFRHLDELHRRVRKLERDAGE